MIRPQVAVPVDHAAAAGTLLQQPCPPHQGGVETVECASGIGQFELRPQQHVAIGGLFALKVRQVLRYRHRDLGCAAIEGHQHRHQGIDVMRLDASIEHAAQQGALLRQPAHLHQPIHRASRRGQARLGQQRQCAIAGLQRQDTEVHAGGQARVQAYLFATIELARLHAGEVEERVAHRLLQLQHPIAGEE
jgi:hypothetical protein